LGWTNKIHPSYPITEQEADWKECTVH
jgi:hypothetical protein